MTLPKSKDYTYVKNPFSKLPKLPKRPEPGPRRSRETPSDPYTQPNRVVGSDEMSVPGISPERRRALDEARAKLERGESL